jgi:beta-mannosidase
MRLLDFNGKTLLDKTQEVQIPAQSSAVYLSINEKEVLGSASPDHTFLAFDLQIAGQTLSRNEVFFDRTRNLELPLKPEIETSITGPGPEYTVTLRSPVLARDVYLSFGDFDTTLSDNYFDLIPGEEMVVRVKSSATLDQLKQAMKLVSLSDAFFEERPTYRGHTPIAPESKSSR